jgi:hypothetical protein
VFRAYIHKNWTTFLLVMLVAGALTGLAAGGAKSVAGAGNGSHSAASGRVVNPPAVAKQALGASLSSDTSSWPAANGSVDGVSYTFRYPSTWNRHLIYCAPGAERDVEGGHLPSGCASTDVLVGQKAKDIGLLPGDSLTIGGKSARRLITDQSPNVLVSRIYTTMVYDAAGTPLFGFTTQIGAGTDQASLDAITATLDAMAGTIKVEARR